MTDYFEDIAIADLADGPTLAEDTLSTLASFRESLRPLERFILEKRILSPEPLTLEEVGEHFNLTRERIRQIEKSIASRLNHPSATGAAIRCWIWAIAAVLRQQIGPIVAENDLEARISATFPPADSPDVNANQAIDEMARHLLRKALSYSCTSGLCLSEEAAAVIANLKNMAHTIADEIGLLDESELQGHLPDENWRQHWKMLMEQCDLHRLNGHLALRDTSKARAKAALLDIGRPATKEEIGELSGLKPDRAGAQLSLLPGVVRADKKRWGLAEWVEDEYEGIPAEIIQRINEDGGTTRLNRLLEELPRMFRVSESSVRAYLNTPAFRVEHGWVSVADESGPLLGRLEDVIDGHEDNGDPYWEFEIEDHHLNGYSIHGVPGEITAALGCEFGGKTTIRVRTPSGCQDISVIWRKTSMHGPEIGRLGPSLKAIDARGGDKIRLIIHNMVEVSFAQTLQADWRVTDPHAHIPLKPVGPTITESPKQYAGVRIGTPIVARLTAATPTATHELRRGEPGRAGEEG